MAGEVSLGVGPRQAEEVDATMEEAGQAADLRWNGLPVWPATLRRKRRLMMQKWKMLRPRLKRLKVTLVALRCTQNFGISGCPVLHRSNSQVKAKMRTLRASAAL